MVLRSSESYFYLIDEAMADVRRRPFHLLGPVTVGRGIEALGWVSFAYAASASWFWGGWGVLMCLGTLLSYSYLSTPVMTPQWLRSWPSDWLISTVLTGVRGLLVLFAVLLPVMCLLIASTQLVSPTSRAILFLAGIPTCMIGLAVAFVVAARTLLMPCVGGTSSHSSIRAAGSRHRWWPSIQPTMAAILSWKLSSKAQVAPYLTALAVIWGLELVLVMTVAIVLGGDSPLALRQRSWSDLAASEFYWIAVWRLIGAPLELFRGRIRWCGLRDADCRCKTA